MVRDGIGELLDYARPAGMALAIEPLHPMYAAERACVNTLAQANDLCDELAPGDGSALGVAVDVYHVWWDPQLEREIARAGKAQRLLAFHLCDWLVPTTDLLNDRGMMGDGVIDLGADPGLDGGRRLSRGARGRDLLGALVEGPRRRRARHLQGPPRRPLTARLTKVQSGGRRAG